MEKDNFEKYWCPILIIVVTFIAFGELFSSQHTFLLWDDMDNIVRNNMYRGFGVEHLNWMFTSSHLGVYEPLSWMLKSLEFQLFGLSPVVFHLANLLLHCIISILFYFIGLRIFREVFPNARRKSIVISSMAASLFFAIHPLRVEVVAWASGQSYALAGLFSMLAVHSYLKHLEKTAKFSMWLVCSVIFYIFAVLSKSAIIMLPVTLLLLDYYPFRRGSIYKSLVRKIPYLVVGACLALVSFVATKGAQVENLLNLDVFQKMARAAYAIVFYLQKTICPVVLSSHYRVPEDGLSLIDPKYLLCLFIVLGTTIFVYLQRRRLPWLFVVWINYLAIILPVLGLIQHGMLVMAADRYTYLSSFGWILVVGAVLIPIKRIPQTLASALRKWIPAFGLVLLVVFTMIQVRTWRNTETLWRNAINVDGADAFALNNLGYYLIEQQRYDEAALFLGRAVVLAQQDLKAVLNYGVALENLGRLDELVVFYRKSLTVHPGSAEIHNNLGSVFGRMRMFDLARYHYEKSLALEPNLRVARENLNKLLQEVRLLPDMNLKTGIK